jgi:hypothetical protein
MNSDPAALRGTQSGTGGTDLERSVATVQQQCDALLQQMTTIRAELSELTGRETVLRAVLERNNELEPYVERLRKILGKIKMANEPIVAIDSATLHLEPFPYAVIDHVLPSAFYDALLTGLPPVQMFETKPDGKQHLDVPLTLAPTYGHLVWGAMAGELVPQVIAPRLIEKFRAQLDEWISRNWPDVPPRSVELHGSGGRIMFRRRGYRIRPHRDPKWSFMTCILYLARPTDSETWGTQLYEVADDQEARNAAPYWIDEAKCRLVNDVEFKPNRLLVFLNSGGAHGASIPADALPADLERYIYQFRVGPGVEAVANLRAMLPEERSALWTGKALVDY